MSRLINDRTLKVYELIQMLAEYDSDTDVIIDFELENETVECPICEGEYQTEPKRTGMVTTVDTKDYDRWRAVHLICKED